MDDALTAIGTALTVHDGMQALVRDDGLPTEAIEPAAGFLAALESQGFTVRLISGEADSEHSGAPHEFRTACRLCGKPGMVHLSIITPDERVEIVGE